MQFRTVILLVFLFVCFRVTAQQQEPTYTKQWALIDSLIDKQNQTKAALQQVLQLYSKAEKMNHQVQQVKALVYRLSLEEAITEKDANVPIEVLENAIKKATDKPVKSLLHALLAQKLLTYFNSHRWQLYNRTNTTTYAKESIETWSSDDFNKAITYHYLQALQPVSLLQQMPISTYDALLIKGNTRKLRPTLFDLLAHEALEYFKSDEAYVTKPSFAFNIDNEKALGTSNDFVEAVFTRKDSTAHALYALQVFQQLLQYHEKRNIAAWMDVNVERIEWVNRIGTMPNKKQLYVIALKEITDTYPNNSGAMQAWYLQARQQANEAATYSPFGDTSKRYLYVEAKARIEKIIAENKTLDSTNEGTANMRNLLYEIKTKQLSVQIEHVNLINQPFRVLVAYKNIDTLYTKIYAIPQREDAEIISNEDAIKRLLQKKAVQEVVQYLPSTYDYQTHAVELKNDGLSSGMYAMLCSNGKGFKNGADKIAISYFYVSNIAYVSNGKRKYYVVDRGTGAPLYNAKVSVYENNYRYYNRTDFIKRLQTTTNKQGYLDLSTLKGDLNIAFDIQYGTDRLWLKDFDYYNNYTYAFNENTEAKNASFFYFMDRGIYRPGQSVFFKVLAVTKDTITKQSKLYLVKDSLTIYLWDANNRIIDSIHCLQNDYGTVAGSFKLPTNTLTGNFRLSHTKNYGEYNFMVEEYKRPNFYVQFNTNKTSYRLNDTIVVTGAAKGFAGNAISNANVKFSINRRVAFTYGYKQFGVPYPSGDVAIKQGEITTKNDGSFAIPFKALAAEGIDSSAGISFQFSISLTVTDNAGETHDATQTIQVGTSSVVLKLNIPTIAFADSLKQLAITTSNLSGESIPTTVQLTVTALQSPNKIIRERLWKRPDQFVMSRFKYEKDFPTDDYNDDANPTTWPALQQVLQQTIYTNHTKEILLDKKWPAGYYKIEATTKDSLGHLVQEIQYVQVFDTSHLPYANANFLGSVKAKVAPEERAVFVTGTAYNKLYVLQQVLRLYKEGEPEKVSFTERSKGVQTIYYPITEADRGGFAITEAFVIDNRFYTHTYHIQVPWTNKQLKVQYATYRDKTLPGSKETWTISVKGDKGETAAAEMLTSMYDASLDALNEFEWKTPLLWRQIIPYNSWNNARNFNVLNSWANNLEHYIAVPEKTYDRLINRWNMQIGGPFTLNEVKPRKFNQALAGDLAGIALSSDESLNDVVILGYGTKKKTVSAGTYKVTAGSEENQKEEETSIASANPPATQIRRNFNETALFIPQLYADSTGKFSFSFTIPDAVTQWKWQSFAHTKNLQMGMASTIITTQKKIMVQSNAPRFVREGDQMEWTATISNTTGNEITGQATLELIDAITNTSVDGWFQNIFPAQYFTVPAGGSMAIKFPISIPFNFNKPLLCRIIAKAGNYTDGEEKTIPVVTNRMLVTESLPLLVKGNGKHQFHFTKLAENKSASLTHESITVEYTANPIWYAVQALPYLMEYPYECAEQTFNRLYANTLAAYITAQHPRIKKVFDEWRKDSTALQSNLSKNEELKQILLQETPWVLAAESETQQKKNIALLFDVMKMADGVTNTLQKLQQLQLPNGAFAWFKGGYEDRYMTTYILTGIGKLQQAGALTPQTNKLLQPLISKALVYWDNNLNTSYKQLLQSKSNLATQHITEWQVQYFFMRSFFKQPIASNTTAYQYYYQQAKTYWVTFNLYHQALLGTVFLRNGASDITLKNILPSITQNAITNSQGMYWKNMYTTASWYEQPVSFVSTMVFFMKEVQQQSKNVAFTTAINNMRTWLILNKQTNHWGTTIATADACNALLGDNDLLNNTKKVNIQLGNILVSSNEASNEAGTGYFKKRIDGAKVSSKLGDITVTTTSTNVDTASISYGSVYWQYFEDLDKIKAAASPLAITKKLFIEKNTDRGKLLVPINDNEEVKVGDKVMVRLILKTDRDMDYVHLKDMRAATMEPLNVLSNYKYQDGLGYYEATKDASTNFFFGSIRKGTYVFTYPVYITHTGKFSAGIASIQCMYAPQFTSHSEGFVIRAIDTK